jgi:hypothetical protein
MCGIAVVSAVHQQFAAVPHRGDDDGDAARRLARRDADDRGSAGARARRRRAEPLQGALMRVMPLRVST